jgi:exonuclease III
MATSEATQTPEEKTPPDSQTLTPAPNFSHSTPEDAPAPDRRTTPRPRPKTWKPNPRSNHTHHSQTLKVLTLNINGNFHDKSTALFSAKEDFDIILFQETGQVNLPNRKYHLNTDYMTYAARGEHTHPKKGVAIIIKEHLAQHITKETVDPQGHFMSLTLEGFPGMSSHKLLISSVYMPTNIDRLGRDDPTFKLATTIHNKLIEQAKNHDTAIIGGDFNETRNKALDRSPCTHNNTHPGRILEHTIREGLTDVFRSLHLTTPGHTHSQVTATTTPEAQRTPTSEDLVSSTTTEKEQQTPETQNTPASEKQATTSTARLDYILAKHITPQKAEVGISVTINSDHTPLAATFNFTVKSNDKSVLASERKTSATRTENVSPTPWRGK